MFDHFDEDGLTWALSAALATWGSGAGKDRELWRRLQANGMRAHFRMGRERHGVRAGVQDGRTGTLI